MFLGLLIRAYLYQTYKFSCSAFNHIIFCIFCLNSKPVAGHQAVSFFFFFRHHFFAQGFVNASCNLFIPSLNLFIIDLHNEVCFYAVFTSFASRRKRCHHKKHDLARRSTSSQTSLPKKQEEGKQSGEVLCSVVPAEIHRGSHSSPY